MSNCLRSLWIHQVSLFCLLVLVLHIFNILFHRTSRVLVSAHMEHEGSTYNCMRLCVFTKIASSVWKNGRICLYLCNHFFYALCHNDCLLFHLLFIVTNNILFRTNLSQCKERNLKSTSDLKVLTLPGIKIVHFSLCIWLSNFVFSL